MEREEEQLYEVARNDDITKVKTLIVSGVDISFFGSDGPMPLMHATKLGHTDVVKVLLDANAHRTLFLHLTNPLVTLPWTQVTKKLFNFFSMPEYRQKWFWEPLLGKQKKDSDFEGDYLEERVTFSEDKLVDSNSKAVMMAWEKPLMEPHAKAVCSGGGNILNDGFEMGLEDTAFQQYGPAMHTIIEVYPQVYERLLRTSRGKKDSVKILFGHWQDILSQLESHDGSGVSIRIVRNWEHLKEIRHFMYYVL